MCWSHMIRNVDKRLATVNPFHLKNLRSYIYLLQPAQDRSIFGKAVELYKNKYINILVMLLWKLSLNISTTNGFSIYLDGMKDI